MKNFLKNLFARLGAVLKQWAAGIGAWIHEVATAALDRLNRIPKDRYQHFALGAALAAGGLLLPLVLEIPAWFAFLFSAIIVTVGTWGKEYVLDGAPDRGDILVTILGAAVVWVVAMVYLVIL